MKAQGPKPKAKRSKTWIFFSLLLLEALAVPVVTRGQEVNREGWSIPDLRGLIPYSIQVKNVNGIEKTIEKFLTPDRRNMARITGSARIFAYAVDSDRDPKILSMPGESVTACEGNAAFGRANPLRLFFLRRLEKMNKKMNSYLPLRNSFSPFFC